MARAQALEPFGFSSTCDKYALGRQIDSDDPAELHLETKIPHFLTDFVSETAAYACIEGMIDGFSYM